MEPIVIWSLAILAYAAFWCWYVGFRGKISAAETEQIMRLVDARHSVTPKQRDNLYNFLANDDGRDFVMVNLLELKKPVKGSRKNLDTYQKIFLGALLRKAGHPVMIASAASGNIENVACDNADDWMAAGMVRYRSRRDFMEMLPATIGSEHHGLKLDSLAKTFAFPASPWFVFGGPRVLVALALALVAALAQLVVST
jgi:hypothetical protein